MAFFISRAPGKPRYTNVVIADNPQRCYCHCNLFSVILSVLKKISCTSVKGFNSKNPLTSAFRFSGQNNQSSRTMLINL